MTIDIGALRKFQEVWEPVIKAIPAVMELQAKQADMDRWVAAKKLELEKAQKEIDAAYAEADRKLAAHNAEVEASQAEVKQARASADAIRANAEAEAKAAADYIRSKSANLAKQVTEREARVAQLDAEIAKALADAVAPREAKIAELQATISDLEKRQATAEKALDALRAKLG